MIPRRGKQKERKGDKGEEKKRKENRTKLSVTPLHRILNSSESSGIFEMHGAAQSHQSLPPVCKSALILGAIQFWDFLRTSSSFTTQRGLACGGRSRNFVFIVHLALDHIDTRLATQRARVPTRRQPLVNTLLVKQMVALDQFACNVLEFEITQANQAALVGIEHDLLTTFDSRSNQLCRLGSIFRHAGSLDVVDASSALDIVLGRNGRLGGSEQGREQHHVLVGGVFREETRCGENGVIFWVGAAEDVDDPAARVAITVTVFIGPIRATSGCTREGWHVVRLDDPIAAGMARGEPRVVYVRCCV